MKVSKLNKAVFTWVFPEITIISHMYGIGWYNSAIRRHLGSKQAVLDMASEILSRAKKNYDKRDMMLVESYLLSLFTNSDMYLQETTIQYFYDAFPVLFQGPVRDAKHEVLDLYGKEINVESVITFLNSKIEEYIIGFTNSFNFEGVINKYSIGRNIIVEFDKSLDNCTIVENIIQTSKFDDIQFLPHII